MSVRLWNLLHDGVITQITSSGNGYIFTVAIPYLRHMFHPEGISIIVSLTQCTLLEYQAFDQSLPETNPQAIADIELEVLSATEQGTQVQIVCVEGILRLCYSHYALRLDSGTVITLSELDAASKHYWTTY